MLMKKKGKKLSLHFGSGKKKAARLLNTSVIKIEM